MSLEDGRNSRLSKEGWGGGPWNDEDDRYEWRDMDTGLVCLIHRGPTGALCGYVGVPPGHPWHKKDYGQLQGVDVHGGLTYSRPCADDGTVCHVPLPWEAEDMWWLGFDCAHAGDVSPGLEARMRSVGLETPPALPPPWTETYKTVEYVSVECSNLARQVADAAISDPLGRREDETVERPAPPDTGHQDLR